jgi:hypothetical protein
MPRRRPEDRVGIGKATRAYVYHSKVTKENRNPGSTCHRGDAVQTEGRRLASWARGQTAPSKTLMEHKSPPCPHVHATSNNTPIPAGAAVAHSCGRPLASTDRLVRALPALRRLALAPGSSDHPPPSRPEVPPSTACTPGPRSPHRPRGLDAGLGLRASAAPACERIACAAGWRDTTLVPRHCCLKHP